MMTQSEWIMLGEVGTSSKTMWSALNLNIADKHRRMGYFDIPYDWDDFSRCLKYYKECNLTKEDLQKIKKVIPWWAPYIDNWEKLCDLYENSKDSEMYHFMENLRKQTEKIEGGEL